MTPQETSTGFILNEVVTTDYMLCKSLWQKKWQYLKRKKYIRDITFQLSTIWIDAAKSHIIFQVVFKKPIELAWLLDD